MIRIYYSDISRFSSNDLEHQYKKILQKYPLKETEKLTGFRYDVDKKRLVAGKLLLLKALSDVNIYCKANDFSYSAYNRIFLPGSGYDFNISHSGALAACGIISDAVIGIDIEKKSDIDFTGIAGSVFSDAELKFVFENSKEVKNRFFQIWTLKESYCKALGIGISISLNKISFNLLNNKPELDHGIDNNKWEFISLTLENDYQLAVCYSKSEFEIVPELLEFDFLHLLSGKENFMSVLA
ncbi:MAG: 4'-phosphopantetheinyl transferase superfamily protein [Spirochaetales bacterium]|nr:4'-phosphopantetheinyl transferase superfamily protein [Spirochaetales bacterium]